MLANGSLCVPRPRQVKQAINQQASSLNVDAARVKAVERSMRASHSRHAFDGSGADWWNALGADFGKGVGAGGVSSGWADISDENSDVSSNGLTSDTDTTVGSCATMNKVKHTLGAAFGPAMAIHELQERARYRRAVRHRESQRHGSESQSSKIHYPSRPPARSGASRHDQDALSSGSPRPRLSRYRTSYAAYAGANAAYAGGSSWNEQHRMAVLQNQVAVLPYA